MEVSILGSQWKIVKKTEAQDSRLKDIDGFCDWSVREIVIEAAFVADMGDMVAYEKEVVRHEIIHAFFYECGLAECSASSNAWALNEEMVDWFARLGPKIMQAWSEAGVL